MSDMYFADKYFWTRLTDLENKNFVCSCFLSFWKKKYSYNIMGSKSVQVISSILVSDLLISAFETQVKNVKQIWM